VTGQVYDEGHVALHRWIGRAYNNPLGESAFPLLQRLLGLDGPRQVLDAGCGRGGTALWWARHGARVVAFDPSLPMLAEAERRVGRAALSGSVALVRADLRTFRPDREFDLVVAHDVLCYSDHRARDLRRLAECCRAGGILSVSDYFGDGVEPTVRAVVAAWGIRPPLPFDRYARLLDRLPVAVLLMADTTRRYAEHWRGIRRRIETRRPRLVDRVGRSAVERLERQIRTIERAVESRRFGHLWLVLERQGREAAHV